ncbi:MAG: hypothetical protein RL660_2454 [Bacteroidota bacterium]|jgi:gliding motility-associated-like protein
MPTKLFVMNLKSLVCLILFGFCSTYNVNAQIGIQGHVIGGLQADGHQILYHTKFHYDNVGNKIIYGSFESTTMPLNPPANTVTATNNGIHDMYLIKHDVFGNFLWGFGLGGSEEDGILDATTDASGDIYICGYFRDSVDMDPSPTASYWLVNPLSTGTNAGYAGDIFLAKYSASGVFQWAFSIGSSNTNDIATGVKVSNSGSVYIVGQFNQACDFNPGPGTATLVPANGLGFLAKYSAANGSYIFALNFGGPSANSSGQQLELLNNEQVALIGTLVGTNVDMDPSAGTFLLTAPTNQPLITIYDTNFAFIDAYTVPCTSIGTFVDGDTAGNAIYLTGWVGGTNIDFDPSASNTANTSNGAADFFVVKYDYALNHQWSQVLGSTGEDRGYAIDVVQDKVYYAGFFASTCDFDASIAIDNLTSSGNRDGFISKLDTSGNYFCTKQIGGTLEDEIHGIHALTNDTLWLGGHFTNSASFAPTGAFQSATSNGSQDIFLMKYKLICNPIFDTVYADFAYGDPNPCDFTWLVDFFSTSYAFTGIASYAWNFGDPSSGSLDTSSLQNPTHLYSFPGTYTVTLVVTSAGGLVDTMQTIIVIDPPLTQVTTGPSDTICIGQSAQLSACCAAYYDWSPSATLNNPNIDNPIATPFITTVYTVTASDMNGCTATNTQEVVVLPPANVQITPSTNSPCLNDTITLTATGSSLYTWTPTPGLSVSSQNSADVIITNTSQTYTVTATDNIGCTTSTTININASVPNITITGDDTLCLGQSTTLVASGATSYSWTGGISNNTAFTPNTTTTYTVTGTNANGCTSTASITVVVVNLSAQTGTTTTICQGLSTQLSACCGTSYAWTPSASLSNPLIANPSANPATNTTYTVLVTDANGCTATNTQQVNVLPAPTAQISSSSTNPCLNDTITLTASGGVQYTWTATPGLSVSSQNTAQAIISNPTQTYTVTATDNDGCTTSTIININASIPALTITGDNTVCLGQSTTLAASGAISYVWSGGIVNNTAFTPSTSTSYTVTGTDANGCTASTSITVTVINLVVQTSSPATVCQGLSTALSACCGTSYSWSPSASLNNALIANPSASPIVNTIYTVLVTDVNGCTGTNTQAITVAPTPTVQISASNTSPCISDTITLSASGASTYNWVPTSGLSVASPSIAQAIINSATQTYTVIAVDNSGCTSSSTISIAGKAPIITITGNPVCCPGQTTVLSASGAQSYSWSGGIVNNIPFSPAATTTYTVVGTDANGCTSANTFTVSIPQLLVEIIGPTQVCEGQSASLSAGGALTYYWTPTIENAIPFVPTSGGTYTVIAVDVNGCTTSATHSISILPPPSVSVTKSGDIACNTSSPILSAAGALSYTWAPTSSLSSSTGQSVTSSATQTTTYTVTGVEGLCADTASITVYFNEGAASIFVPNAFTPNSDGVNDCFAIKSLSTVYDIDLKIYDRWGKMVFATTSLTECWNGVIGNYTDCNEGIYYYTLRANTDCGKVQMNGDVMVTR